MKLNKIDEYIWEISSSEVSHMNVPAQIFASESMLPSIKSDKALKQLSNVASLPGIQTKALVMPDVHEGYGFPIGAVAAIDAENGIISPGGIGYDINCGVRLLKSDLLYDDIKPIINNLSKEIYKAVPSGVGISGKIKLNSKELDKVLNQGMSWAKANNYADDNDIDLVESNGFMQQADSKSVSQKAKERAFDQLGTMGSGNHFVEIDYVDKIYDEKAASILGLSKKQIVILIHTGSRGLGHQVASDYIKSMINEQDSLDYKLPDKELAAMPIHSELGKRYFEAMCASANFAWVNRQIITWELREAWQKIFPKSNLNLIYDIAHNIAKIENHSINDVSKKLIVHRKGATRAFPAHHPEIPDLYKEIGQPVIIPGSMGTCSYVLVGNQKSMELSFGSACHGAGRRLSRTAAKKQIDSKDLLNKLENKGIHIQTAYLKGLSEEAPDAYKDVDEVVEVVHNCGIASKVAKLKPLAVIKG